MRLLRLPAAGLTLAVAIAAPAAAKPVPVDLHVEGADHRALTAARYVTDSTRVRTEAAHDCGGSGGVKQLPGATALGALVDAAKVNPRLDPLGVSDAFSFGLLVCGVGGDFASGASSYWLYKVNHVAPEVGGDAYDVKPGDDVLWYFVDAAGNRNTGDELAIRAPARVRRGDPFEVRVWAYDATGARQPADGAVVRTGGGSAVADGSGVAVLTVNHNAVLRLRARRGADVPSAPVAVCVDSILSRCSAKRGGRIYGSIRGERLSGTPGPNLVLADGGADHVSVRGGGIDRVRCGKGRDVVLAGRLDRVARDCEVVRRRGRR
jgi:hypothetical protein